MSSRDADTQRGGRPRRAGESRRLRILVADRHAATRAGLRIALEQEGYDVCAECADTTEAVARAAAERPDVCILDGDLPGGAVGAAEAILLAAGSTRIVVLAASSDSDEFFSALRAGADGYLLKDAAAETLADCVRMVAAGEAYVAPPFVTRMVETFRASRRLAAGELSVREREVLTLLGRGLATKQVAARLGLSPTTVRRHVSSALRKLGCSDRAAALALLGVHPGAERR